MKSSRLINSYLMTFMLAFDIFFQGHWNIQSRTFLLAIQPLVYSLRLLNGSPFYWTVSDLHTGIECCWYLDLLFFPWEQITMKSSS